VTALFAYGTLMVPAVMEAVTGRRFPERAAVLRGFARHRLRGRLYPAVVEAAGAVLEGRLYEGIDAATLARLDRFEGRLYQRRRVTVEPAPGVTAPADLYVLADSRRAELLAEPWDAAAFVARHLGPYLRSCEAFRASDQARAEERGAGGAR
jgi:gamma-glutamylcyclotransferase (GGCT)/AIG2-like uncharacterized protein YtfP